MGMQQASGGAAVTARRMHRVIPAWGLPALATLLALSGCVSLPTDYPRAESSAATAAGRRGRRAQSAANTAATPSAAHG